jgi:large subunit ribosomal protein L19
MDTKIIEAVTGEFKKAKHPDFRVGDIIEVHTKLKENGKERVQMFKGIVLAIKGAGVSKTFTVRKISYGVGVERIFPLYSPRIAKIKIIKRASKIKRSKLYYLRDRVGKSALKAGVQIPAEGEDLETKMEEEVEEKDTHETDSDVQKDKKLDDAKEKPAGSEKPKQDESTKKEEPGKEQEGEKSELKKKSKNKSSDEKESDK